MFRVGQKVRILKSLYKSPHHQKGQIVTIVRVLTTCVKCSKGNTFLHHPNENVTLAYKNNKLNRTIYPNHIIEDGYLIPKGE